MKRTIAARLLTGSVAVFVGFTATLAVARPADAVTGWVTASAVSEVSASSARTYAAVYAYCPPGTLILGGGVDIPGGDGAVAVATARPDARSGHRFYGFAYERHNYPEAWSLRVWAVCGSGVTGHEIVTARFPSTLGAAGGTATAVCPAGKRVIGAGGVVGKTPWYLDTISVPTTLNRVQVEGFAAEDVPLPSDVAPTIIADAVCIHPVADQQLVTTTTAASPSDKFALVGCPRGTRLHSAFGSISGAVGSAYLDSIIPSPTTTLVHAREVIGSPGPSWSLTASAICAR